MTETRTLHFDNARQLQSLYANDLQLLKRMEDSLGVKVTKSGGWEKIECEREKLDRPGAAALRGGFGWATELSRSDRQTRRRFWNRTGRHRQDLFGGCNG